MATAKRPAPVLNSESSSDVGSSSSSGVTGGHEKRMAIVFCLGNTHIQIHAPWDDEDSLWQTLANVFHIPSTDVIRAHHVGHRPQDLLEAELGVLLLQRRQDEPAADFLRLALVEVFYKADRRGPLERIERRSRWLPRRNTRTSLIRLMAIVRYDHISVTAYWQQYAATEREDEGSVLYLSTWYSDMTCWPTCDSSRTARLLRDITHWADLPAETWDDRVDPDAVLHLYFPNPQPRRDLWDTQMQPHILIVQNPLAEWRSAHFTLLDADLPKGMSIGKDSAGQWSTAALKEDPPALNRAIARGLLNAINACATDEAAHVDVEFCTRCAPMLCTTFGGADFAGGTG
eukprot:s50_g52.t1